MGKRGPQPIPSQIKRLKGNPGHRPISEDEPKPLIPPGVPEPPEWFEIYAKTEWGIVAPELHRMGLLTAVDLTAFAAYCQSYARWRAAEEWMTEHENTVVEPTGVERRAPQAVISQAALANMNRFGSQFGLSPSARTGITGGRPVTADPIKAAREWLRRDPAAVQWKP